MDLTAVLEPADSIQFLGAVGKQQCALEYGSAFSRASRSITPAGETVFVSGTASIDASGATTNIGDALGQINSTIENVRAVLRDMNAADEDVVNVVAYCKTTEVGKVFDGIKGNFPWPWVTVICDICRPELLFEIEATAMLKQRA
jgi:enamine deaminase RidA (YjgF/YER057c/UK114 family)